MGNKPSLKIKKGCYKVLKQGFTPSKLYGTKALGMAPTELKSFRSSLALAAGKARKNWPYSLLSVFWS